MDKQSRRRFLKATLGSASVLLLAACAPAAQPGPTAAPAKPAAEPTKPAEKPAEQPAAKAPATKDAATVEIWHTEPNPATTKAMDNIIARFQQKHPNVTVSQAPQGWADMEKKILAGIAAGTLPEISQAIQYVTPSLQAKDLLVPVDDVVNSIGKDNIFPHVRDTGALLDGKWWGITHAWGADNMVYRGDVAEKKGLKEPRTWAEFIEFARGLHEAEPGMAGFQLAGTPGFFVNEDVYMLTGSNGGQVWKEDGEPNLTSTEALEMLQHYKDLAPLQPQGWLTQGWIETNVNLAKGSVGMICGYGRSISIMRDNIPPEQVTPDRYRIMKYKPVGPSSKVPPEQGMRTQMDGEHWVVYKKSRSPEWAMEFLKFFYERENQLEYTKSVPLHLLTIDKRLFSDDEYLSEPLRRQWKQQLDVQFEYMDKKLGWPLLMLKESDAKIPHVAEVANSGILADMVYDVVDKGQAPEQAADRAQKRIEQLIKGLR
jgi:multiple sugar transport system substrate-binding protein